MEDTTLKKKDIEELEKLFSRSQIATLNKSNNYRGLHYKYLPYVLTEQGIMMISGLLKSDIAVKVNVQIIDAFVKMRKYISNNLYQNEKILINHENRLLMLEESFDKLNEKEKINHIFYEGQIYDAYSLLIDILSKSKEEVIIIDNYAGKELLDIIKDIVPYIGAIFVSFLSAHVVVLYIENVYITFFLKIIITMIVYCCIMWFGNSSIFKETLNYIKNEAN